MPSETVEGLLTTTAQAALIADAPSTSGPEAAQPSAIETQTGNETEHATSNQHVHQLFVAQFWYELISEHPAADFVGLKVRTLQGYRYRGGGPDFVRISARCIKYRRIDLLRWAESRLRTSTSDRREAV